MTSGFTLIPFFCTFAAGLMQGRKDQKQANKTGNTVLVELDGPALTRNLRRFVEKSDLSIPKIASDIGVSAQPLEGRINAGDTDH